MNNSQLFAFEMNELARKMQSGPKEVLTPEDIIGVHTVIKTLAVHNAEEVILYCAAVNACNTYVKQKDSLISYAFKKDIHALAKALLEEQPEGVCISFCVDRNMPIMFVNVYDLQFSFHCVPGIWEIRRMLDGSGLLEERNWDGIRKQNCARSFYYAAYHHHEDHTAMVSSIEENLLRFRSGVPFATLVTYAKSPR